MRDQDDDEFLEELAERAFLAGAESSKSMGEEGFDLVDVLRGNGGSETPDLTLGGYIARHDRPPAFEGSDGEPYTVGIEIEATDDPQRPFAGFLVFVRWAATGAGIMAHAESEDIGYGPTEEQAKQTVLDLSLYEVKAELDAAVERKRALMEE